MKTQLVVRIMPDANLSSDDFMLEWMYASKEGQRESETLSGTLADLTEWRHEQALDEQDLPIYLLTPGSLSSTHHMWLNDNQRKHWQQALPFLLEEKLASDLESQFLISALDADGDKARSTCIAHKVMVKLLKMFVPAGVDPQKIVAETQFFKGEQGVLTIWLEKKNALLASGDGYGQLLDPTALSIVVPGLLEDEIQDASDGVEEVGGEGDSPAPANKTLITVVKIHSGPEDEEMFTEISRLAEKHVPVEWVERSEQSLLADIIPALHHSMKKRTLLDFRTGTYKCSHRASRRLRLWKPVAIAASFWLGVELLFNIANGFYFEHRTDQLREENLATYQELRPEDRTVVDVRDRLTKFLRNANTQQNEAVFLVMLQTLSKISDGEVGKSVKPRNMDFNESNGRLSLDVQAASFDLLNRYLDELRAAGLNARMETGNQDSQGISARLIVRKV